LKIFSYLGEVEQFDDHEIVYTLRIPGASSVSLRVRYALDDSPNPIYHLRYVASAELDKSQSVSVRQFHDCCVTKNIQTFLQELGFTYDHEFFAKGDIFRKGRMKITVAKISTVYIIDY
jgi:mediator of RNA polymerase II transcription subunit 18